MAGPKFFVVARVVSRDGAMKFWHDRLYHLCQVSLTERLGNTYYWGADLDGEPDTLWGLEGYSHPVGFFKGHVSSDIFKREMALVDSDKLLKHEQGLNSRDYDLKHYDLAGGWLTREDDDDKDSMNSYVVVHHLFAKDGKRTEVIERLLKFSEETKAQAPNVGVQSCAVLEEISDVSLVTLWVRTKTEEAFKKYQSGELYSGSMSELVIRSSLVEKMELHRSKAFIGHIDK